MNVGTWRDDENLNYVIVNLGKIPEDVWYCHKNRVEDWIKDGIDLSIIGWMFVNLQNGLSVTEHSKYKGRGTDWDMVADSIGEVLKHRQIKIVQQQTLQERELLIRNLKNINPPAPRTPAPSNILINEGSQRRVL